MQLAQQPPERPVEQRVRRQDRHADGTGAEGDADGFRPRAGTPQALHNRARDAQYNRLGKTELNNANQNEKEINRECGEHHRQPYLKTGRQDSDEEVAPELNRGATTGNEANCSASPRAPPARISAIYRPARIGMKAVCGARTYRSGDPILLNYSKYMLCSSLRDGLRGIKTQGLARRDTFKCCQNGTPSSRFSLVSSTSSPRIIDNQSVAADVSGE